jgi:hypothetical protein
VPSLQSRVDNILSWAERYRRGTPSARVEVERVRFDMQQLQDPQISGVEYQQGEPPGYDVREHVLQTWGRRCAYCEWAATLCCRVGYGAADARLHPSSQERWRQRCAERDRRHVRGGRRERRA